MKKEDGSTRAMKRQFRKRLGLTLVVIVPVALVVALRQMASWRPLHLAANPAIISATEAHKPGPEGEQSPHR